MNAATVRTSSLNEDVLVEATATCPAGKIVIGGGGKIVSSAAEHRSRLAMFESWPSTTTSWKASAVILGGFSGATATVTSYAICATAD